MDSNLREILIAIIERLRTLEAQQDSDARLLLQISHALNARPDWNQTLQQYQGLSEQLIEARHGKHHATDQPQSLDDIIQQLKAGG